LLSISGHFLGTPFSSNKGSKRYKRARYARVDLRTTATELKDLRAHYRGLRYRRDVVCAGKQSGLAGRH